MNRLRACAAVVAIGAPLVCANAQFTNEFATLNNAGEQANLDSWTGAISEDGRFVLFQSEATNLIDQDGDGIPDPDINDRQTDFFVRDRLTGTTELVSVNSAGQQANAIFGHPNARTDMSADGRFVVFTANATNLVDTDGDGVFDDDANSNMPDVFVRDRIAGTTELISVNSLGVQGNGASARAAISRNGRWVVFSSQATNLVDIDGDGAIDADANGALADVFLRDRETGVTELISVNSLGEQASNFSPHAGRVSDDGRYVAFISRATNLIDTDDDGVIDPDTNSFLDDIFVRDRVTGITQIVSINNAGQQHTNGGLVPRGLASMDLSGDGRFVVFSSGAGNLIDRDGDGVSEPDIDNFATDVFVHDRQSRTTDIISLNVFGEDTFQVNIEPRISRDGNLVVFGGRDMLVDRNGDGQIDPDLNLANRDIYLFDRTARTLELVSMTTLGTQGNDESLRPVISADGRFIAYTTQSTNLVDRNGDFFFDDDVTPFAQDVVVRVPGPPPPPPDEPPTLSIGSHVFGQVVTAGGVLVSGTATDDVTVDTVTVNGVEAVLASTDNPDDPREVAFNAFIDLAIGQSLIIAVATDNGGNTANVRVPVSVVAPPLACDVDGDQDVDRDDIMLIFAARGQPADGPDDPRDANGDGIITVNDGRECVLQCTNPACAPN